MNNYDILVLGGGPAGITIAKNIRGQRKVGIIRPEDHSMIYCAMPYVLEGLIEFEKTLKKDNLVTDPGAELIRDTVIKVNFNKKTVKTLKGEEYGYEKWIIATGARPILPPIDGINLNGVATFKTEKDLRYISNLLETGLKNITVVGAGAIGIELAQALNEKKLNVNLIDMASHILPNMLDNEMVEQAEKELQELGINLFLDKKVVELRGKENIEKIILDDGKIIESELLIIAVGMTPNIEFLKDTDLEIAKEGIIVNEKLETNIPDVYAVGDCVQFKSGITGEVINGRLATNAVPMGRVISNNLMGGNRSYKGFYNGAATKVGKYFVGGTGLTEKLARENYDVVIGYSNFTTAFPIMPFAKEVRMKLIVNNNTNKLLGGQVISGEPVTDKIDKITMAIQYDLTIDQLLEFSYSSQPYQSFYPANNLIVKAAEEIISKKL